MSWGHATSTDLTHWNHQPIALLARGYPGDITEMFFSGSAIADTQNTSGFGTSGKVPFVAMYTSYYPVSQNLPSGKSVNGGQQAQSIAYSLDEGMTWTTYDAANPVILNPPTPYADQWRDFRDPFLFWHEASQKWISVVSLAQLHKLLIFTSPNLKDWTYASEFGPWNAVGGVWECPSLFPLAVDGDDANTKWVMQIGLNPGGPPGVTGSGTQYIVGTFDGIKFVAGPNSPPSAPTSTWTTTSVSITTSVSATTSASITSTTTTATATATATGNIVFQDFEGAGDFASRGWVATGGLIGAAPAQGSLAGQQSVTGYAGSQLVNTFLSGDSTTGTLTSPAFTISLPYINFLIGGGNALGTECINLKVQGKVVRTATGANAEQLLPTTWDVTDLIGQAAVLEIVDQQTGGWGHVLIDQITFTGNPAGDIVFQDFEGAGDFASRGWVATGGLIGAAPAQGSLAGQQSVTGYAGSQLINTFLSGDSTTGTLTSPTFTISLPKIKFLIGGGNSPGMECVNLKVQDKVVRTATGANAEQLLPTTWDVTDLIGQAAVLEIVDQQTGGWGHILVDQITFTGSTSTNSLSKRSDSSDTWDFNGTSTFADYGWTATGDFVGKGPAQGTLAGQQVVTGNMGNFVNTFLSGDATTGTLTSPTFTITQKKINFLIGGGNSPGTECINLKVQGQVVRTATGANAEQLLPTTWDVTDLLGQSAVIEIVDLSTTGWGHILIDEISFSNISIEPYGPNWMDYGPDFYAATTFNGLSSIDRIDIAWMNNWQYATAIPTSPWRSMLSVARKLSLKTIDDRPRLIQQPTANWTSLQTTTYSNSFDTVSEGNQLVQLSGKLFDITVAFSDRVAASSSSQFGIILRATSDLAQQTRIGYDFSTKRLFVDRTRSGNVGFDGTFPSTYFAPLVPSSDGRVTMRILLDWSSVEVFGGQGEVTISAQIFPQDNGVDVRLFSGGGSTNGVTIDAKVLDSAYDSSTRSTSLSTSSTSTGAATTISSTSTTSVAGTLTTNGTHWTWRSDFAASNIVGFPSGVNGWEVPDFFELQIQGTTQSKWVLVVTPAAGSPAGGNGVFALTGSFDGSVFTADAVDPTTLWLDYGRDWDGAMSWENVPASDGRRVLAAVMNSYGANPPTNTWKGMLSFPRTLELKQLNGKLRFLQLPVGELDAVGTSVATITNQTLAPGQTLLSNIHSRSLDIRITFVPAQGSALSLSVRKGGSQQTVIKYIQSSNQLSVDRNASGNNSYDPAAGGVHTAALQADANGKVQLRVLVDECSIEVYGGQGEAVISDLIFPDISSDGLALSAMQGNVVLESVEVRSISH
ncbi:hypothetical protein PoHVEF18_009971 [Penicillium ochrochloron]